MGITRKNREGMRKYRRFGVNLEGLTVRKQILVLAKTNRAQPLTSKQAPRRGKDVRDTRPFDFDASRFCHVPVRVSRRFCVK